MHGAADRFGAPGQGPRRPPWVSGTSWPGARDHGAHGKTRHAGSHQSSAHRVAPSPAISRMRELCTPLVVNSVRTRGHQVNGAKWIAGAQLDVQSNRAHETMFCALFSSNVTQTLRANIRRSLEPTFDK